MLCSAAVIVVVVRAPTHAGPQTGISTTLVALEGMLVWTRYVKAQ